MGTAETPTGSVVPRGSSVAPAAAPAGLKLAGIKYGAPAPAAATSAADNTAAARWAEALRKLEELEVSPDHDDYLLRLQRVTTLSYSSSVCVVFTDLYRSGDKKAACSHGPSKLHAGRILSKCKVCSRSGAGCSQSLTCALCSCTQACEACQVQAAAFWNAAARPDTAARAAPPPPPPLKTAGIKWGAANADADVEADAAAFAPAAAAAQPPLQIAGIKWGAVAQPETAPSQVWFRPLTAS